jgi:hypothetical protein
MTGQTATRLFITASMAIFLFTKKLTVLDEKFISRAHIFPINFFGYRIFRAFQCSVILFQRK